MTYELNNSYKMSCNLDKQPEKHNQQPIPVDKLRVPVNKVFYPHNPAV